MYLNLYNNDLIRKQKFTNKKNHGSKLTFFKPHFFQSQPSYNFQDNWPLEQTHTL